MGSGVDLCHQIAGQSIKRSLVLSLPAMPFFFFFLLWQSNREVNGDRRKQNLLNQMPLGSRLQVTGFSLRLSEHEANLAILTLRFVSSIHSHRTASPGSILVSSLLALFIKEDCRDVRKACSAQNCGFGDCSCLAVGRARCNC